MDTKALAMRYFHDKEMHFVTFSIIYYARLIIISSSKNHACDIFSEKSDTIQYLLNVEKHKNDLSNNFFLF
jgi:hypothetical protein